MSAANRKRGHRAELAVCAYLREHGYPDAHTTRSALGHDGTRQPGDIEAIPGVVIEVKDRKGSSWPSWIRKTKADAAGRPWLVIRRKRGTPDVGAWPCVHGCDGALVLSPPLTVGEFFDWWDREEDEFQKFKADFERGLA